MASTAKRRLDREEVLKTAEDLVDREGWRVLSMARLAQELGIKSPSLYNHVESLSALLAEISTRSVGALMDAFVTATVGRSGPDGLRALSRALWDFGRTYPNRYDLAMRTAGPRGDFLKVAAGKADALGAIIDSYGLEKSSALLQFTVFGALHGVIDLTNNGVIDDLVNPEALFEEMLGVVHQHFTTASAAQLLGADHGGSDPSEGKP